MLAALFDGTMIQGTGSGKGIKCVAETIAHEKLHKDVYLSLSGTDTDSDMNTLRQKH